MNYGISDHDAILFEVDVTPKPATKPPSEVFQFHKGNYDGLRTRMASFADEYLGSCPGNRSVDENWARISDTIKTATDQFLPSKMTKAKRHLPWVSPEIKRMMNRRDRAHKRAKQTGKAKHQIAYRRIRSSTTKCTRETHAKYVDAVISGIATTPNSDSVNSTGVKRAWSYLNLLRSEFTGIPTLFWNNRACTDDTSKAEALREQYDSVFTKENLTNLPDIPESPYGDIPDICFTARGIQSQLESIRPDKACGLEQIPARVLKETATELAPVLASLFQQSFDICVLPSDWKYANITAIFKKGHRTGPKNYRPVSLTSLTSKITWNILCVSKFATISPQTLPFIATSMDSRRVSLARHN